MIKVGGPGGGLTVITCDHKECVERFNSYSISSLVPTQAQHAKWTIEEGKRTKHGKQPDRHYCPKHKPKPITSGATPRDVAQHWTPWKVPT